MATYRLMDGVSGRPGVGSSGTQPPAAGTPFSGNYCTGLNFQVTQGGLWFQGYWWWVPSTVSQTGPQKFCLWQQNAIAARTLVPNSTVTSGTLTAGAFNFVPLTTPLLLPPQFYYLAVTAYASTTGFPGTTHQFGAGNPYAAGITNGPLFATASNSPAAAGPQQPFNTLTSDPAAGPPPTGNDLDDLLWIDVQVTDKAPAGATYRAFPNLPVAVPPSRAINPQTGAFTLSMEFSVTQACTISKIWFYSVSGASVLPTRTGIWVVSGQTELAGSDNSSPTWSGAAGSGWVSVDYSSQPVTLSPGVNYKVAAFSSQAVSNWFNITDTFWGAGQFLPSGLTAGPLTVPGDSGATPGQDSWNPGAVWGYPNTSGTAENAWVDIELTPLPPAIPSAAGGGSSMLKKSLMWADL